MSSDMAVPTNPEKDKPTARICVSKDEAAKMKVGSDVTISVSGQVKSLHPDYNDKEMYEVEIENPTCEVEASENDENDENIATMPREKLKKKIMPKSDEE